MRRTHICVLVLVCQLAPVAVVQAGFEDRVKALYYEKLADKYYRTREIPEHLDLAIEGYRSALRFQPTANWRMYWKMSRSYWMMGEREVRKEKRIQYFTLGTQFGEKAVKGNPDSSQSHLWYGLALGSAASEKGVMNTFYQKEAIKSELQQALRLNPKEINAFLGLAGWYYNVPKIFGGDKSECFRILEKALTIDPNFTATLLLKAKLLIDSHRSKDARKTLLRLLRVEKPSSTGAIGDKAAAKVLLEQTANF